MHIKEIRLQTSGGEQLCPSLLQGEVLLLQLGDQVRRASSARNRRLYSRKPG